MKDQKKRSACPNYGTVFLNGKRTFTANYFENTTGETLRQSSSLKRV